MRVLKNILLDSDLFNNKKRNIVYFYWQIKMLVLSSGELQSMETREASLPLMKSFPPYQMASSPYEMTLRFEIAAGRELIAS